MSGASAIGRERLQRGWTRQCPLYGDRTLRAFDVSMWRLGVQQLDLYLMHWPSRLQNCYVETWKAMAELQATGRVRSIGVSNFSARQFDRIIGETGVVPVLNQIELHRRFQWRDMRRFHAPHGIVTQSWSPLGMWKSRNPAVLDPVVRSIAQKHSRIAGQVILRWHLQSGLVRLTRSSQPDRIRENFDALAFSLDDDDVQLIASMDRRDGRLEPDPETAEF